MAPVELRRLTKRYSDGSEAVAGLDLEVADGELMVLVGPSGCGKSTTLRMIAGLEDITSGDLRIDEQVVNERAPKDRDIAMVFQNYALYPHMTVRQNIGYALKLAKVPKDRAHEQVEQTARVLELTDHLDRKPSKLSGGQRQRVAMGRAIVREPKVFLMDEPLSNLDAKLRVQMRAEIAALQRRLGTTTIYVTHDQTEAMTLGDRVAVLHEGVLQQVDTPRRLYDRPANAFVAGFIGSPPMNLLPGRPVSGGVRCGLGLVPHAGAEALDGEVLVGVRPEHLHDAALEPPPPRAVLAELDVMATEWTGAETHAELAGGIIARLPAESRLLVGQRAGLWLDAADVRLFDAMSGEAT